MDVLVIFLILLTNLNLIISIFQTEKGLGLLLNMGEVLISKNSQHKKIGVLLLANFTLADVESEIRAIQTEVDNFKEIPGIKENNDRNKIINHQVKQIKSNLNSILRFTRDTSTIADSTAPDRIYNYECNITIPPITGHEFNLLKTDIQTIKSVISLTTTSSELDSNPSLYKNILDALFAIADLIGDARRGMIDRLRITSAFQNGEIPEDLGPLLDAYTCMPNGKLENLQLDQCTKEKLGLLCIVNTVAFMVTETYKRLIPINYEGVQLSATNQDEIFILNSADKLGILNCGEIDNHLWDNTGDNKPPITDLLCNFEQLEEQCALSLERDHWDYIIKHCNFTFIDPDVATQTKDGLLVMGNQEIIIKEEQENGRITTTLSNKRPVLILSADKISINVGTSSFTYTHHTKVDSRKLTYTYLTGQFIEEMKNAAYWQDLAKEIGHDEAIDLGIIIILLICLPTTVYLCSCKIKTSNLCQKLRDARIKRGKRKSNILKNNYEDNKQYTRAKN